ADDIDHLVINDSVAARHFKQEGKEVDREALHTVLIIQIDVGCNFGRQVHAVDVDQADTPGSPSAHFYLGIVGAQIIQADIFAFKIHAEHLQHQQVDLPLFHNPGTRQDVQYLDNGLP